MAIDRFQSLREDPGDSLKQKESKSGAPLGSRRKSSAHVMQCSAAHVAEVHCYRRLLAEAEQLESVVLS